MYFVICRTSQDNRCPFVKDSDQHYYDFSSQAGGGNALFFFGKQNIWLKRSVMDKVTALTAHKHKVALCVSVTVYVLVFVHVPLFEYLYWNWSC